MFDIDNLLHGGIEMRKYNYKISKKANDCLMKRELVVRRQKGLLALLVIIFVSFGILLTSNINAFASSKKDIASYNKYYVSIQVKSGDTLWTIADEYIDGFNLSKSDYIKEICTINEISKNQIHAGDYIIVPYYSQEMK